MLAKIKNLYDVRMLQTRQHGCLNPKTGSSCLISIRRPMRQSESHNTTQIDLPGLVNYGQAPSAYLFKKFIVWRCETVWATDVRITGPGSCAPRWIILSWLKPW